MPLLDEARQRFEAVAQARATEAAARMAAKCFVERGDCLRALGRLDDAAADYEEAIRRAEQQGNNRQVAVGKGQLGTVRLQQGRYPEALKAYEEGRAYFTALNEPGSVATAWHQTGMVYQTAGQPEEAEDAYRESLKISVRHNDAAGQARTLAQWGMLYDHALGRMDKSVDFLQQAVDKYVEIGDVAGEGRNRNNLAIRLGKLRRLDEARREIGRAIDCIAPLGHAELWKSWGTLANIEMDAGNPTAAADAKRKAIDCYLAYRRDGGENHDTEGRIAFAVTQSLLAGDPATAASLLQNLAADPDFARQRSFIQALQAIVAGSRDHALAAAPELDYGMAAEILLLIETLEQRR